MIERPDLSGFASGTELVVLPTGRIISLADVVYDTSADVFRYGNLDVTDSLGEYQKQAFPTYYEWAVQNSYTTSDDRTRSQGREPVPLGPTTAGGAFIDGVTKDALSLTTRLRAFYGIGPENAGKMSGLAKLTIVVAVVGIGWLAWKFYSTSKGKA